MSKMENEKSAVAPGPRVEKRVKLVPPDGGWGWMVLIGTALSNIFNQSMLSLISLLYGDSLKAMGYETQGAANVQNTMLFCSNFGGPIAAIAVKKSSPRVVAITGACLCTLGILGSGFSTNIVHLMLTYGVLLGTGLGFIQNSTFVAINSYFKLRKSRAVGLANVGTGLGQCIMPHVVQYLLQKYAITNTCTVLASLSSLGIIGVSLIQPVEKHMKMVEEEVIVDETMYLLDEKHKDIVINKNAGNDHQVLNGGRRLTEPIINNESNGVKQFSSQKNIYISEKEKKFEAEFMNGNNNDTEIKDPSKTKDGIFMKLYHLMDMSLLGSPRFLNIIIGTSLAVTSIQSFSMLFPAYLVNVANLPKENTATCMSAVAAADIMGRLILPIAQDKLHIKARWMLIITSIWIIVVRQILAYQTNFIALVALSMMYGFGRSTIIVCRNIAISEYCKPEQVPAAVGLGMLVMGIIVPPVGVFLGWVRDYTDSYLVCISGQNVLLLVLLIAWIPDMFILMRKEKKLKKEKEVIHMT